MLYRFLKSSFKVVSTHGGRMILSILGWVVPRCVVAMVWAHWHVVLELYYLVSGAPRRGQ